MTSAAKPDPFVIGPDLRAALVAMVRKRVPESEVEDIVQMALAEAIQSPHAPADSESLRRWIFGVAKNKVVDYHRRAGRESFDMPDVAGTPAPHVEADLLRWAERHLPQGSENQKTLEWMLREGEGEKLESIAESEKLPPPRVRQRVSRLRRHFKENWQKEVALLAALGVIVTALVVYVLEKDEPEVITHEVVDPRAEPMRRLALEKCGAHDWKPCLEGLDEAKRLDPAGDARPEIQRARQAAESAPEAPSPGPQPTTSGAPVVTPPPVSSDAPPSKQPPLPKTKYSPAPDSTEPPAPTPVPTAAATPAPAVFLGKGGTLDSELEPPTKGDVKPAPSKKGATKPSGGGSGFGSK